MVRTFKRSKPLGVWISMQSLWILHTLLTYCLVPHVGVCRSLPLGLLRWRWQFVWGNSLYWNCLQWVRLVKNLTSDVEFPLWGKEYGPLQRKKKWKQLRRSAITYSFVMRPFYMLICSTSWNCQHSMDAAARCLRRQIGGKTLAYCFWSLGKALPTLS